MLDWDWIQIKCGRPAGPRLRLTRFQALIDDFILCEELFFFSLGSEILAQLFNHSLRNFVSLKFKN